MKEFTKEYLKTILKGVTITFLIPNKNNTVYRRAYNLGVSFLEPNQEKPPDIGIPIFISSDST